ncbi:MAG: cytochrome c oxidase subunit II [Deltaproteobacteria bacterium]|nr:cytochrome c oxidase subunit II [Deltaproteobacteria bacterium]
MRPGLAIASLLAPPAASTGAESVDTLMLGAMALVVFFSVLIFALVVGFSVRYRAGSDAPREDPPRGNMRMEVGWLVGVALLGVVLWAGGAVVFVTEGRPPQDAVTIAVVAKQWMWKAQHDNGRREINRIHVPAGQPVVLRMVSEDVIHSLFVPAFRLKQDVLPGRYTTVWFEATRPGTYPLYCAEYCGADHSGMRAEIEVMAPADYAAWLAAGAPARSLAAEGAGLFRAKGCSGCHGAPATVPAPPLEGLYQRPVVLSDGSSVTADDAYLRDAILQPNKQIVAGYSPLMPTFQGQLDEDELSALIAYVRSLRDERPHRPLEVPQ